MVNKSYWFLKIKAFRVRFHKRSCLMFFLCFAATLLLAVLALSVGTLVIHPDDLISILLFNEGSLGHLMIVKQIRLPRVVASVVAGSALGISGIMMQSLARNRLANPEFLGINDGAALSMILSVMLGSSQSLGPWWLPAIGAMIGAGFLLLVAGGMGTRGYRVLIVGIGIGGIFKSFSELLLSKLNLQHSSALYNWSLGNVSNQGLDISLPVVSCMVLLVPLCMISGRKLHLMQFSENIGQNLGMNLMTARLQVYFLAVVLAALSVGMAGPISFVALAAPIITSLLAGPARVPILGSAGVGALLVLGADTIGRVFGAPAEIPVGIVTTLLGGPFLLWVILKEPAQ